MAAGSAAERAEAGGKRHAAKRGQEVVLTFSMQGTACAHEPCPANMMIVCLWCTLFWPLPDVFALWSWCCVIGIGVHGLHLNVLASECMLEIQVWATSPTLQC